uniref:Uncharacterized protein n=1 Tax=Haptolina ericina TaxID=156174 RepID=A0A7S3ET09_9EUKA
MRKHEAATAASKATERERQRPSPWAWQRPPVGVEMVHVNPYLLSSQLRAAWRAIPPLEVSLLPTGHCTSTRIRTIRLATAWCTATAPSPVHHVLTFRLSHPCCRVRTDQLPFGRDVRRSSRRTSTDAIQAAQMALVMAIDSLIGGELGY